MPINIYKQDAVNDEKIAWLCDSEWELPRQIYELEKWLSENRGKFTKGSYIADVGYTQRKGAFGGGAVITLAAMEMMLSLGMEIYLSEYPESESD